MLFRKCYSVHLEAIVPNLAEEVSFTIRSAEFVLTFQDSESRTGEASLTMAVLPSGLQVREGSAGLDGSPGERGIGVPEEHLMSSTIRSIERILAFAFEVPVHFYGKLGFSHLLPESPSDEQVLRELGDLHPYVGIKTKIRIRASAIRELDEQTIDALLEREVGLAIFRDALCISRPIGQYREFWRVLESAFGLKNSALVNALAQFSPTVELGFDEPELRNMWILRGRASHAESSAGLKEYTAVSKLVEDKLQRLRSMALQVLLTKANWGIRSLGVHRLAQLQTYVDREGIPVIFSSATRGHP